MQSSYRSGRFLSFCSVTYIPSPNFISSSHFRGSCPTRGLTGQNMSETNVAGAGAAYDRSGCFSLFHRQNTSKRC